MKLREINRDYFYSEEWKTLTYYGYPLYKYPADLVTYQQIIAEVKPEVIIETGTCTGASALFFRHCLNLAEIDNSLVITCDIKTGRRMVKDTPGIEFIVGSSIADSTVQRILSLINNRRVMVSLDSDHVMNHVLAELSIYKNIVSPGQYIVVEDTFLGEYGVFTSVAEERFRPDTGKTPKDAVDEFMKNNKDFILDKKRNKIISMNPNGYLKRC